MNDPIICKILLENVGARGLLLSLCCFEVFLNGRHAVTAQAGGGGEGRKMWALISAAQVTEEVEVSCIESPDFLLFHPVEVLRVV